MTSGHDLLHGNEVCGPQAIARAADDLVHGRLALTRGRLTLVPVANPLAFRQNTRGGERNLNRRFVPRPEPRDYEDRVTRQFAPLLAAHDALLDLHSFHTPGEPFAMVGPRDNAGPREPFARSTRTPRRSRSAGARCWVRWRIWGWRTCRRRRVSPARRHGSPAWCCARRPATGWRATGTASTPCRPAT